MMTYSGYIAYDRKPNTDSLVKGLVQSDVMLDRNNSLNNDELNVHI